MTVDPSEVSSQQQATAVTPGAAPRKKREGCGGRRGLGGRPQVRQKELEETSRVSGFPSHGLTVARTTIGVAPAVPLSQGSLISSQSARSRSKSRSVSVPLKIARLCSALSRCRMAPASTSDGASIYPREPGLRRIAPRFWGHPKFGSVRPRARLATVRSAWAVL